jgi:hypothetical protein
MSREVNNSGEVNVEDTSTLVGTEKNRRLLTHSHKPRQQSFSPPSHLGLRHTSLLSRMDADSTQSDQPKVDAGV